MLPTSAMHRCNGQRLGLPQQIAFTHTAQATADQTTDMAAAAGPEEPPKSQAQVWAEGFIGKYKEALASGKPEGVAALYVSKWWRAIPR